MPQTDWWWTAEGRKCWKGEGNEVQKRTVRGGASVMWDVVCRGRDSEVRWSRKEAGREDRGRDCG